MLYSSIVGFQDFVHRHICYSNEFRKDLFSHKKVDGRIRRQTAGGTCAYLKNRIRIKVYPLPQLSRKAEGTTDHNLRGLNNSTNALLPSSAGPVPFQFSFEIRGERNEPPGISSGHLATRSRFERSTFRMKT